MSKPYDPAIRKTENGAKLYQVWKRVRKDDHYEAWDYFPTFYEWALQSGYTTGAWLRKIDKGAPFVPDNCTWYTTCDEKEYIPIGWADSWNKTANRIRKHYGMSPLEGTDYDDL
jgi:hypothetical protein